MTKLIKLIFLSFLFIATYLSSAIAGTGAASVYKIIMHKVEMCETGSTIGECVNGVTIGSGQSSLIDIASTTAGATAAAYGDIGLAIAGKTYTWMQVTLDRKVRIKGSATDDNSNTCYTTSTSEGNFTTSGAGHDSTATETTLTMAFTSTGGTKESNSSSAVGSGFANAGDFTSGHKYLVWRGELSSPVTIGSRLPTVKLAFGTANALGASGNMGNKCTTNGATTGLYGAAPDVTITFE